MSRPGFESRRLPGIRAAMRAAAIEDEAGAVGRMVEAAGLTPDDREAIVARAVDLVHATRAGAGNSIMEGFLAEYGLSTREGVALMCLAEALLRVPDTETIDALIEDKIGASDWASHLGRSSSPLVNASTWALLLTGKVLGDAEEGLAGALHGAVRRLGEPVIRAAVARAMRELGHQFVLGRNMGEAVARAAGLERHGYAFSYDMLGEAARTEADARAYHLDYSNAITALAGIGSGMGMHARPGVSVKLSALHPRYELGQRDRVMTELTARLGALALLAKSAGIGLTVDAEEAERLDLSLDVIEAVFGDAALAGWDGFGIVVQAYGKRAAHVIDWIGALAEAHGRRVMVRLVKGAYWDTEIKRAQTLGLAGFPVFTRKASTDVAYLACARRLLGMSDRLYPQFATHNAHTVAAVMHMAGSRRDFEFQRLHGMGEALHEAVREAHGTRCRVYAPVGVHHDLLAYLVRRLLENGANSSFVNQIVDESVAAAEVARDPVRAIEAYGGAVANPVIAAPAAIFAPDRRNAKGWDLADPLTVEAIDGAREPFRTAVWEAGPMIAGPVAGAARLEVRNPARPGDIVGTVTCASPADIETAMEAAREGAAAWGATSAEDRARILRRVADLYEANASELFALAAREAGKTWPDCVGEVREASDFARFYANEAVRLSRDGRRTPRGVIACISPWNFPVAIFSGQVFGALAAGNAVIAKPAEQTPLVAARAMALMHEAGIPRDAAQLLPGDGANVGAALASDPRIAGVCFTGSTETARIINRSMAEHFPPDAPFIAETGGLNAMLVDSTALPEQAVRDIVASAFQSAGQRCSALRVLYVQREVEERILTMLFGAMDALRIGDPWALATDVGPVIDEDARARIEAHCALAEREGRVLKRLEARVLNRREAGVLNRREAPGRGTFVPPTVLRVDGIEALAEEVFGPVLHVASYRADEIDAVVDAVNATGYGLTFGLHTRIDDRVQHIVDRVRAGNIYVNRNQIGAVVGSQPFGGEGLSGTGPKAGGPHYVRRLMTGGAPAGGKPTGAEVDKRTLAAAIADAGRGLAPGSRQRGKDVSGGARTAPLELPGPTGESNRLTLAPRGVVLCLGPGTDAARAQLQVARRTGNAVVVVAAGAPETLASHAADPRVILLDGQVAPDTLGTVEGIAAVACSADRRVIGAMRAAIALRAGPILPLITEHDAPERYVVERHVCVDTTAGGGNVSLLAQAGD